MPIFLPNEEPKGAVDFSTPLPKGKYPAIVSEAEAGYSKSGNEMVTVIYELAGSRKVWDYFVLSEAAIGLLQRKLKGLGLPYKNVQYSADDIASLITGRACVLDLTIEKDQNGNLRNRVFDVLPSDTPIEARPAAYHETKQELVIVNTEELPF